MAGNGGSEGLAALRHRLEALARAGRPASAVLPFGIAAVDTALSQGGLALGALHEFAGAGLDEEDGAIAAAFVAGIPAPPQPRRPGLWGPAARHPYRPGPPPRGLAPGRVGPGPAPRERAGRSAVA